jgi:hypothetical protein
VDVIPSPHEEPIKPTPVVEEMQAPMASTMEVNPHNNAQAHIADDMGNPQKIVMSEGAQQINGESTAHTEVVAPKPLRVEYAQQ